MKTLNKKELLTELEITFLQSAYEPSERGAGYSCKEYSKEDALYIMNEYLNNICNEDEINNIINSYNWIKVKKFNPDDYDNIEDAYQALEKHHLEETTFLINKIRDIVSKIK